MKDFNLVHKVAAHEIKDAVDRIAVTHPEGEAFFDALDEYIKHLATTAVYESLFIKADAQVIVLSGGFGRCVADRIDAGTLPKIPYILFNGGMRKGSEPEILRDHFPVRDTKMKAVFLDDTIYGGKTFNLIQEYLNTKYQWHEHIIMDSAVVVYDGCPVKRSHIDSIFRYYDFYSATPNYDFKEGVILKPSTDKTKIMIKYGKNTKGCIPVLLENKKVGEIAQTPEGWQYTPKGQKKGGEKFENIEDCKASLEKDDE